MAQTNDPLLDLDDIQGDVLQGLPKNSEKFIFFKILDVQAFKNGVKANVIGRITTALLVREREKINQRRKKQNEPPVDEWLGLNLSFTKDGLTQLIGTNRPQLDPSFERGAADPATISALNDPATSTWVKKFQADRIDGVFFVTGPSKAFVESHSSELLNVLGNSISVVYSEIGNVRPDAERGHEHFGFRDGVSQPGIRGLTTRSNPTAEPDQGLPGQDLIWPGQFVFGYPSQDPNDPLKPAPPPPTPAAAFASGQFNQVPVTSGGNHDEERIFVARQYDFAVNPLVSETDTTTL